MLHITNGDSAAATLRVSGVEGEVLPWRDVLHEGPIPQNLTLAEMSEVRARFVVADGWAESLDEVREEFRARDAALERGLGQDEIVLWFEADLYDQLQIIQVLDWLGSQQTLPPLSMICIGEFPGFDRFDGLGQLSADQLAGLFPSRRRVQPTQLDLARRAWSAVAAPTPERLVDLLKGDTRAFEFLAPALTRLLEHYPSTFNGLDRTEHQILQVVSQGNTRFKEIFPAWQALEERTFMGDLVLWTRLLILTRGPAPALSVTGPVRSAFTMQDSGGDSENEVRLTSEGREYLKGKADYAKQNGVDRWVGGVSLTGESPWRWDVALKTVRNSPTKSI